MNLVFLLIFWLTSLRSGGPQQGPVALAVDPGLGSQVLAFSPGVTCVRRPVGQPGQTPMISEGVHEATSEEDPQDSELGGGHPRVSLDLLAGLSNAGVLTSPRDLIGLSRSPGRSPLLRC
jgi:hypothetical protein